MKNDISLGTVHTHTHTHTHTHIRIRRMLYKKT